ncbi:MAG: hypothetical protein LBQ15_02215 [Clostridium sp.]|nr:hypothetical protein [Clostridium sp.]
MRKRKVPNSPGKKFWFFALAYLATVIGDIVLTYKGTPDLAYEANPLVAVFGLGWGALILANVINYVFYVTFAYHTFVRYRRPTIPCSGMKQFVSMLFFF